MESIHHNLANQMIATLHTQNENIVNLEDSLMRAGLGGDMMEKASLDIGQAEDGLKETKDQVDT